MTPLVSTTAQDEKAIQDLVTAMATAWKNGDWEAYATVFTEESDYITFDGQHLEGQRENARLHKTLFTGILRGSTLEGQGIRKIRFLSPEIALVHMTGAVKLRWFRKAPKNRLSIQTLVAVKQEATWKFTAFHNSRIKQRGLFEKLFS